MPLISIETNQILDDESVLKEISAEVAKILEKPEGYVMLKFTHNPNMLFAGNALPLAHIKLKSLGLPEDNTAEISNDVCLLIEKYFNVPPERNYIEFANPERHMWGWNCKTF